jgi:hypothetical protein
MTTREERADDRFALDVSLGTSVPVTSTPVRREDRGGAAFDVGVSVATRVYPDLDAGVWARAGGGPAGYRHNKGSACLRYFAGNAFFLRGGPALRSFWDGPDIGSVLARIAGSIIGAYVPDDAVLSFEGSDVGIEAAAGHEWRWKFVTFDIEWLGVYVPVVPLEARRTLGIAADDSVRIDAPLGDHPVQVSWMTFSAGLRF